MIELEIKSWNSPDVVIDKWNPSSLSDICFLLEVEIGEVGDERCDLFQLIVATPEGLREKLKPLGNVLTERATIVISEFSWADVKATVSQLVRSCTAKTWSESVLRLQQYFRWEYEDYTMEA